MCDTDKVRKISLVADSFPMHVTNCQRQAHPMLSSEGSGVVVRMSDWIGFWADHLRKLAEETYTTKLSGTENGHHSVLKDTHLERCL